MQKLILFHTYMVARYATMRHDSMALLNNPKVNIEILLPELVKIKENIF